MMNKTVTESTCSVAAVLPAEIAPTQDPDDLLDIEAVCRFFGGTKPLHPATIYRGLGTRYPRPVRVSPNVNRWLRSECEAALKAILHAPREPLPSPRHRGSRAAV
jgi:predicted DNA-binding transcriptional regulator AlpA